jgi:hypothetical protein
LRFLLKLLGTIAVALVVGFGLSYYALGDGRLFGAMRVGPWVAWPAIGVQSPDPYTRAYLAKSGVLPLGKGEGIAFTASTDSRGRGLDRGCRYRIDGTTPAASFWTLEAVAKDGRNIVAPGALLALESHDVARANDGSLRLYVSRALAPQNWLQIAGSGSFQLILTLYDASDVSGSGVAVDTLPTITQEACDS